MYTVVYTHNKDILSMFKYETYRPDLNYKTIEYFRQTPYMLLIIRDE